MRVTGFWPLAPRFAGAGTVLNADVMMLGGDEPPVQAVVEACSAPMAALAGSHGSIPAAALSASMAPFCRLSGRGSGGGEKAL